MESGSLGPYQDRARTFPSMRSKPYNPLVRIKTIVMFFWGLFPLYFHRRNKLVSYTRFCYRISYVQPFLVQIFRVLMGINVRVLLVLLLLGFGGIFYIGASTSPVIVFVLSICIISFLFSIYLAKWVLAKDEGPPEMSQVNHSPKFAYLHVVPLSLIFILFYYFFLVSSSEQPNTLC